MRGRGLLPIVPGAWGVVFVPITSAEPELWELELRGLDALLHKPTDDMVATLDGGDRGGQLRVDFSQASLQLAETAHRLDIAVIDDIAALRVVSDRWTTHAALADLGEATTFDGRRIQVPRAVLLPDLSPASVQTITHVSFPCILKPRVACGPDAAHELAIVPSEAAALAAGGGPVPLPCVAQQYVRHRGTVHKVYCGVVPDKDGSPACRIAVQPRMSSPPAESVEQGAVLRFHSLRDMPKGEVVQEGGLDEELCVIAARRLAQRLQLRLFGFDVVVEDGGAHFIVDVNFLPSLKGVHGAAEIVDGAVALAIREHEQRKRARDGP
ncbi:unnamed protein product [Pedinophyceae sp. YPF-701]|nr:unnamed protein product [Pedinophyceae sp. YPF-701]